MLWRLTPSDTEEAAEELTAATEDSIAEKNVSEDAPEQQDRMIPWQIFCYEHCLLTGLRNLYLMYPATTLQVIVQI
jgi:hypothetical protein